MGEEAPVKFEQALSGRSTCRATGEKIEKGQWRVGLDVWISGRVATAWMKPLPFLEKCCHLEYALNPSSQQGSCRATGTKFARGDVRFVATAGDPSKKVYLSLAAAGAAMRPVLRHVGADAFVPCQLAGLETLAAKDRAAFFQAFEVARKEVERFDAEHPPPPPPSLDKPARKGMGKGRSQAAKVKQDEDEEEEEEEEEKEEEAGEEQGSDREEEQGHSGGLGPERAQRPAKRAKRGGRESAAESADGAPRGSADAGGIEEQMTEMERQRAELIARNRERLMALNLPGMAAELLPQPQRKAPAAAQHKGVSRKRLSEVLPRRESSRLRGIAADGSQVHSERQGQVVVVAGEVIRRYASGSMTEEQEPQERHPQGELPFDSNNCGQATDEDFIQLLAHAAASANSGAGPGSPRKAGKAAAGSKRGGKAGVAAGGGAMMTAAEMKRLQLVPDDVAKVTKDATTHLAFHPTTDTLIIACADKKGNVGLWHVNEGQYELPAEARTAEPLLKRAAVASEGASEAPATEGKEQAATSGAVSLDGPAAGGNAAGGDSGSSSGFDGVLALAPPHYEYICGLKWAGGSGRGASLFTASYDGSLRRLDVARGVSELVVSSEDAEYSCMDVTSDGRTALLGDNEGAVVLVDTRQAPAPASGGGALTVHGKKVNTLSIEPLQEQVFATASTDTSIRLWDLRAWGKGAKPLATAGHSQACQAALFAPDGSRRLVSTSFDNTVRVWDGAATAGLAQRLSIKHDNNTGRWVLPFRAVWTPAADGVIIGNMKRFVDIFDADNGSMLAQLSSEHMTAIASRNAVHPAGLPVLASATNSGRIHVYRR